MSNPALTIVPVRDTVADRVLRLQKEVNREAREAAAQFLERAFALQHEAAELTQLKQTLPVGVIESLSRFAVQISAAANTIDALMQRNG